MPVPIPTGPPAAPGLDPQYDVYFGAVGTPDQSAPVSMQIIGDYAYTVGSNPGFGTYLSIFDLRPDHVHPTTLVGHTVIPDVSPTATGAGRFLSVSGGRATMS